MIVFLQRFEAYYALILNWIVCINSITGLEFAGCDRQLYVVSSAYVLS